MITQLLLEHDVDVNQETDLGETALTIAAEQDHEAIVLLLLEHGADMNV